MLSRMYNDSDVLYDSNVDDSTRTSYYFGVETSKIEVYKKYLKNLNISASSNLSDFFARSYAKMLYTMNTTTSAVDNGNDYDMNSEVVSKVHSFSAANSLVVLSILSVIYVIIFVLGVLGNVITCIVIAKNKSMHTAVNFYLFSLAVSDLLLLISGKYEIIFKGRFLTICCFYSEMWNTQNLWLKWKDGDGSDVSWVISYAYEGKLYKYFASSYCLKFVGSDWNIFE